MRKTILMLLCFCLLAPIFAGCSEENERLGALLVDGAETHPGTVLRLNDDEVSFDEFRYYYLNCRDEALKEDEAFFQKAGSEEELKEKTLSLLRNKYAVTLFCREEGIELTSDERDEIEDEIEATAELYGGSESFLKSLHASYMSMQYYREMLEFTARRDALMTRLFGEGGKWSWSSEEFYSYYGSHYLAMQALKLSYRSGETQENHPLTEEAFSPILAELEAGADFWTLIETYGEDDEMEGYPDGYYVTEGEAEGVLYEAGSALSIGEISGIVAGVDGLYLIRRVALKKERMDENRVTALYGYTDSVGNYHPGAYDEVFEEKCLERAASVNVTYLPVWDQISTSAVI